MCLSLCVFVTVCVGTCAGEQKCFSFCSKTRLNKLNIYYYIIILFKAPKNKESDKKKQYKDVSSVYLYYNRETYSTLHPLMFNSYDLFSFN